MFVCLSASVTTCPIFTKSECMLHMTVARFTVSWRSDTSCTSGFIWVTSCLHVMTRNRRCEKGVYSKRFNRGQHGFDTAAYTKTDSPGATRNWGRIWYLRLRCIYTAVCESDNGTRQEVVQYAVHSGPSSKPEPEIGRHDNASDAEMRTTCDWPLNVTWIFQHYNNVSES